MNMKTFITNSLEETEALGKKISSLLIKGDVLAFSGELGAGKTTLIQYICAGLGVMEYVSSPTFTLINEYKGILPVYHFDFYRISEAELYDLGYWEYFEGNGICLVEWADKAINLMPEEYISIIIEYPDDDNFTRRKITISGRFSETI